MWYFKDTHILIFVALFGVKPELNMKTMMLWGLEKSLEYTEIEPPKPGIGEVLIEVKAAALNKRDYWITRGKYPGLSFPLVLGSDGAGMLGAREVIIDPSLEWGSDPAYFSPDFRILGMPDHGTLAEFVKVPMVNVYDKPPHLSWVESAALPVCGVTAFRAMITRGKATSGERMLVTGIGGGVASMALLFGVALGLEIWVTSSSDHKIDLAVQHGAAGGINYTRPEWEKELAQKINGRLDLVIDGAGGNDFSRLTALMNPCGRLVMYGGTRGTIDGLSPQRIFWKQLDILGSTMGSPEDFASMLQLVNQHKIRPIISHTFSFPEANEAMSLLSKGEQFGKVCIEM